MAKNYEEKLNEIVRGEKSAIETYDQILEKFKDDLKNSSLFEMKNDHIQAVSSLESRLSSGGQQTPESSGAWGTVAKSVMGTAKLFGDKSALKALKEGEEHGRNEYNELLACEDLPSDLASQIQSDLLPKQNEHISKINELMDQAS